MTDYSKIHQTIEESDLDIDAHSLVAWAINEIRGLDELCRSSIPGYAPMDSDDMGMLKQLEKLAEEFA